MPKIPRPEWSKKAREEVKEYFTKRKEAKTLTQVHGRYCVPCSYGQKEKICKECGGKTVLEI